MALRWIRRTDFGVSQVDLAESLGLRRQSIGTWERKSHTLRLIDALAYLERLMPDKEVTWEKRLGLLGRRLDFVIRGDEMYAPRDLPDDHTDDEEIDDAETDD